MRKLVSLLVVCAALLVPMVAESKVPSEPLIISLSDKDLSSWEWSGDAEAAEFVLLTSKAEAIRFLRSLPDLAREAIAERLADVDFKREAAVVAYLGGTSGGYDVEISQININAGSVLVKVGMRSPRKDDVVTMILTHPWDMVTLPKKDLPDGDFEFIAFNQHGEVMVDQWMNLKNPRRPASHRRIWHTVRTGETLSSIAKQYGVTVDSLLAVNPGLDPHRIWIGDKLRIPGKAPNPKTYTVKTGDSLWAVAQKYGVTLEELMDMNHLTGPHLLIGQKLVIPSQ